MSAWHVVEVLFFLVMVGSLLLSITGLVMDAKRAVRRRALRLGRQTTNTLSAKEFQRFMEKSNRRVLHEDTDESGFPRQLVRVTMRHEEDIFAVRAHDTTTRHVVYLRVPPQTRTCHEGVAWTFRMNTMEYQPVQET